MRFLKSRSATSYDSPSARSVPDGTGVWPASIRSSVDLPAAFGPKTPEMNPPRTVRLTLRRLKSS